MPALEVEIVSRPAALEHLSAEWTRLFHSDECATPFQSPAWLIPWWRHFENDALRTFLIRASGKLVGLFPLYVIGNELKFLGVGNSDYLGGLIAPGYESPVCECLFQELENNPGDWKCCVFDQLHPESPLATHAARKGKMILDGESCFCASLPKTVAQWHKTISPNLSRDIHSSAQRATKTGEISWQVARRENASALLEHFFSLHDARWTARGKSGVLFDETVRNFHREAVSKLLDANFLKLRVLFLNGEPVAGVYGFCHRNRFYVYLTAFDPRFAKFSFGSVAIGHAIELSIREGCREVDFLRGPEPYKFRFGARESHLVSVKFPSKLPGANNRSFVPQNKKGTEKIISVPL